VPRIQRELSAWNRQSDADFVTSADVPLGAVRLDRRSRFSVIIVVPGGLAHVLAAPQRRWLFPVLPPVGRAGPAGVA
jgi:hypothetical protein